MKAVSGEKKSLDEYFDYMSIDREDRDKLMKDYSHGMKNKMQMLVNIIANPRVLLLGWSLLLPWTWWWRRR